MGVEHGGSASQTDDGATVVETRLPDSKVFEDESVRLTVLGDLYDTTGTDLLDDYARKGEAALAALQGSYLVVVEDRTTGTTLVSTDHMASRAGFVWELPDRILVTNRLEHGPRSSMEVDPGGVGSYLAADGTRDNLTPLAGVRAIRPGTMVRISDGKQEHEKYWRIPVEPRESGLEELSGEMLEIMRRAVAKRLAPFDGMPIMLSLSGGADSKGLLGLLCEQVDRSRVQGLTYYHGEQVGDMDLPGARRAAEAMGVEHRIIDGYRGYFIDTLIDNALRGDGMAHFCDDADVWRALGEGPEPRVVVAGDRQAHHFGVADVSVETILWVVSVAPPESIDWFLSGLPQGDLMAESWGAGFRAIADQYAGTAPLFDAFHPAYLEQRSWPTLGLWRESFSSQAGPVINPFLDRDLMDFVGRLPRDLNDITGQFLHKIVLRDAFPQLFEFEAASGGWNIPDWGMEMVANSEAITRLVQRVDSPLESLVPKEATLKLLNELVEAGPSIRSATSGWRWQLRKVVKNSRALRSLVRRRGFQKRLASPPTVSRAGLLRRLLTLHLALANAEDVLSESGRT